jgi:hypothetical protein
MKLWWLQKSKRGLNYGPDLLILKTFEFFSYSSILTLHLDPQFAVKAKNALRIIVTNWRLYSCLTLNKCVSADLLSIRNNYVSKQFKDDIRIKINKISFFNKFFAFYS